MAKDFRQVFRDATDLPETDRATLAGLLIESLDPEPDPGVEAAWAEEIRRRIADMDAGSVKTIPWEEVREALFDRLNDR
jgi:putative addiction module component (TIGR02574 family)